MSKKILMCAPRFFDIEYEINPWMDEANHVQPAEAEAQWQQIHDIYTRDLGWEVLLQPPVNHLPDLVFTANAGLVINKKVALSRFRQPERQGETEQDEQWFRQQGYSDIFLPEHDFEGEGDALVWNDVIFAGYPWRSDKPAHAEIADFFGCKVVSLQLADARFYHLDTCLTIVSQDTVAVWPKAFTEQGLKAIRAIVPKVIEASDEDALAYGLNAMSDGHHIVLSDRAEGLINQYRELGFNVHPTSISEFQKSGGGVKCLTLELRD